MTTYKVHKHRDKGISRHSKQYSVDADKVAIEEGGVLVFYEKPGTGETLESVAGEDKIVSAFSEWSYVEKD
jgi:hypothetical protein